MNDLCRALCRSGNPYVLTPHICLLPCPLALMSSGTTLATFKTSGVLAPTHAASIQGVFGNWRVIRLCFVRPPVPHSIGTSQVLSRSYSARRMVLTADASFNGGLA